MRRRPQRVARRQLRAKRRPARGDSGPGRIQPPLLLRVLALRLVLLQL
jgi:hypothetical protein